MMLIIRIVTQYRSSVQEVLKQIWCSNQTLDVTLVDELESLEQFSAFPFSSVPLTSLCDPASHAGNNGTCRLEFFL
jgi:hypothetical protein